jgi:leucyl/phenylalanyl-tRNA---protein transferase
MILIRRISSIALLPITSLIRPVLYDSIERLSNLVQRPFGPKANQSIATNNGTDYRFTLRIMTQRALPFLGPTTPFPSLDRVMREPPGLLAFGGDLSPTRLVSAYRQGIFPWFGEDEPILWWSLDPRMVMRPQDFQLHKSLRKVIQSGRFRVTRDQCFGDVIRACSAMSRAGQDGTWIQPEMIDAYCELHDLGIAHSVEAWLGEDLVGGLYGIKLGKVFFGESMFAKVSNASKVAFAHLIEHLQTIDVELIDCQQQTKHLASLGAAPIALKAFRQQLDALITEPLDLSF